MNYFFIFILTVVVSHTAISQRQKLIAKVVVEDRGAGDELGMSIAISENYAIAGAYKDDEDSLGNNTYTAAGSAYIFEKDENGNWELVKKISAHDRDATDQFGYSVALSGDYALIGAYAEDEDENGVNTMTDAGSAYLIQRNGSGQWTEVQKIVAPDRTANDRFGVSVSISGNYLLIGADREDEDETGASVQTDAGSVYVFENDGTDNWILVQKLCAADRQAYDYFGVSVSISGKYAIIGAHQEDEDATGSNSLTSTGSAYIFERDNDSGCWNQVQKITASDRSSGDFFGFSVSMDASYAVVGAPFADKDAAGSNPMSNSGAAYLFERNGSGTWNQAAKLVNNDRAANDRFGYSVSVSGRYAIVGAFLEDEDQAESNTISAAGSTYLFCRENSGAWNQVQKITASDRNTDDYFGLRVALSGYDIMVSAPFEDDDLSGNNTLEKAGSLYFFYPECLEHNDTLDIVLCLNDSVFAAGSWRNIAGMHVDSLKTFAGDCDSVTITIITIDSTCDATVAKTKVRNDFCGTTLISMTDLIWCDAVTNATDYKWKFENTSLNFSREVIKGNSNRTYAMKWVEDIQYKTTYYVSVKAYVNGKWGKYDAVCQITSPDTPFVPDTRLIDSDCGTTVVSMDERIYCVFVPNATDYRWRFSNTTLGFSQEITRGSSGRDYALAWVGGIQYNTTYDVEVKAFVEGTWGSYSTVCQVTSPATTQPYDPQASGTTFGDMALNSNTDAPENSNAPIVIDLYPNPTIGTVYIKVNGLANAREDLTVEVFDLLGNRVMSRSTEYRDGGIVMQINANNKLPKGLYMARVLSKSGKSQTKKFLVQ